MRPVFKTIDRVIEPGNAHADERDFAVASTRVFETGGFPLGAAGITKAFSEPNGNRWMNGA
jgi:hypothetical protein